MRVRKVWRSELLPLSLGIGALLAALLGSAQPAKSRVARLAPNETKERLRVFGKAGDPKLENGEATAVIRSIDGALVDFFRSRAILPTIDQLSTVADIDGVWEIVPMMHLFGSGNTVPVPAKRVSLVPGGVEAVGEITVGGARIEAHTTYRIDESRPLLRMVTTFRLHSGYWPRDLGYGHTVRWGNVSYFVDGSTSPKTHFAGHARWVGRRGAGGDLLLRSRSNMWVQFAARVAGFHGALITVDRPASVGTSYTVERELSYEDLPLPPPVPSAVKPGRLIVFLRDELGRPLPAKLRIRRSGSAEPLFPDQGGLEGVHQFIWTGNGTIERELPPGKYQAIATSGIERSATTFRFGIASGASRVLQAELKRMVPTPGFISADLHLHQAPSVDADVSLENRVVSVAAEGVELAVATDHYTVTDLAPTVSYLRERGILSTPLSTIAGSEVSTLGKRFGHFNVFPLEPGQNVRYRDVTPSELFADARRKSPDGVLQVNHPRLDSKLGYFTYYGLSLDTAEPREPGYDPNFDTLEVYNGDDARDLNLVLQPLMDWIHLLGRGHRYTATGSSDSHNLAFLDPGVPRTYIRHGTGSDDATDVAAPTAAVIKALKAGHVIVSSGPFIEASVQGKGPGETARGVGPLAELKVRVRAAPWVSVSKLEVFQGGNAKLVHSAQIWPSQKPVRHDAVYRIPVDKPTFVIVVVRGNVPLPNVARDTTLPFAFTNPIWIEP